MKTSYDIILKPVITEAERLHRHPQQEGEASRYEVRTLQQGSG